MREITHIVIHHTGRDSSTKDSIWRTHVLVNKWLSWGYHGLVMADGTYEPLREERRAGAHVSGMNAHTLGLVFAGNFDKHLPTLRALQTAARKCADWCILHGLDPAVAVIGHNETIAFVPAALRTKKTCPGKVFNMTAFRARVQQEYDHALR